MVQREPTALNEFGASPGTGKQSGSRWFETSGPEGHSLMVAVTPVIHVQRWAVGWGGLQSKRASG